MKITVEADDGTETVYIAVREFALCGLRMESPMNPSHFSVWAGTPDYLCGQMMGMGRRIRKAESGDPALRSRN